jgi:hypothetical protein
VLATVTTYVSQYPDRFSSQPLLSPGEKLVGSATDLIAHTGPALAAALAEPAPTPITQSNRAGRIK